jgi:hypothetical protein
MLNYFTINTSVEIICFLISLICLITDSNPIWRITIAYLFITCATELTGIYLKLHHHSHNAWLYNISMLIEAIYINLMFIDFFKDVTHSKIIIICGLCIIPVPYIYEVLNHSIYVYNDLTYTLLCIPIIFYALFYFYFLIKNDGYIDLRYSFQFWWVTGVLFYYFGSTTLDVFYNNLLIAISPGHYLTSYIYNILNILLYGCWSYSFICKKWLTKMRSEI